VQIEIYKKEKQKAMGIKKGSKDEHTCQTPKGWRTFKKEGKSGGEAENSTKTENPSKLASKEMVGFRQAPPQHNQAT